jgi:hypothetical protein
MQYPLFRHVAVRRLFNGLFLAFGLLLAAVVGAGETPASDVKVWPVFYHASDLVTNETRTEVFWPLYVRESTPAYTANQILSFPQRYPGKYPNQLYLFWPLSGLRTGNGHDAWFFPCLWSGDDYFTLFPAFYYGWGSGGHSLNLALLQHNHWDDTERLHALWPLFWYWHDWNDATGNTRDNLHSGLLPLFWLSTGNYDNGNTRSASHSGGILLLNWWSRSHSKSSTDQTTDSSNTLFPIFYRSSTTRNMNVAGASVVSADDTLWIFPYWQSHDRATYDKPGPGCSQNSAEAHHVFFPLWWGWSSTEDASVDSGHLLFPFWWASAQTENGKVTESAEFWVPVGAHFFKKHVYDTRNLLGPVLNRTENVREHYVRYDAFFPLFSMTDGETRSGGRVFPVTGWESQHGHYANLWYLFPLGWDCETQDGAGYHVAHSPRLLALHELEAKPFVNNTDCVAGPRRTVAFYPFAWNQRQADRQDNGFLPFWWQDTWRSGRTIATETWIPLLLGNFDATERDGQPTYARQDYLLSILAWGGGEQYTLRRFFPLFSYENSYGRREIWSFLLPFYYETWRNREAPDTHRSSELSIPFAFLPVYSTRDRADGADSATRDSWLFPFYHRSAEKSPEHDVHKLSILWPFWNGEWENGETRIRGLGGVINFYEQDANGFVEQRLLYRLFTRRTRSWFSEHELMPFYAAQSREDGDRYWKFLGGLVGGETRGDRSYFRLLYLPIPTGRVRPPAAAEAAARRDAHADIALNYLRHNRYDRSAIEFALAGPARAEDRAFQLAAATAYLNAAGGAVGKELRSSIPSSLESLGGKGGCNGEDAVRKNLRTLAVKHFENAMALGADRPDTLRQIARAWQDLGEWDPALQKLAESDRLRPRFSTGMERLQVLTLRIDRQCRVGERPATAEESWRKACLEQWQRVLAELQARYPNSPTLTLCEAEPPATTVGTPFASEAWNALSSKTFFSAATWKKLALYERGAALKPGAEEEQWLAESSSSRGSISSSYNRALPAKACAVRALAILNRQASVLLEERKVAGAEARLPRIRALLPLACAGCAALSDKSDLSDMSDRSEMSENTFYDNPVSQAMQNLFTLYVEQKHDPLGYIAVAKAWAATLCPHQQTVVAHELEAVRFEQQYLKQWRITLTVPPSSSIRAKAELPDRQSPGVVYTGGFFDRYVNLDAILGAPDHCTATAECVITSPDARPAVLRLGFDHRLTAELNGAVVFGPKARTIAVRDEFTVPVTLNQGENRLKLTVSDDTLAYGFFARLSAPDGTFMEDLAVSAR